MNIYKCKYKNTHHITNTYIYMNKSSNLLHSTLPPKKSSSLLLLIHHRHHTFPPLENGTSVGDCSNAKASSNLTASHNAQVPAKATTKEAHKEPPRKAKLTKIWWKKTR